MRGWSRVKRDQPVGVFIMNIEITSRHVSADDLRLEVDIKLTNVRIRDTSNPEAFVKQIVEAIRAKAKQ
jgi:hypothetical protein